MQKRNQWDASSLTTSYENKKVTYYDPSYGKTATGPLDFETQAIAGYGALTGPNADNKLTMYVEEPVAGQFDSETSGRS